MSIYAEHGPSRIQVRVNDNGIVMIEQDSYPGQVDHRIFLLEDGVDALVCGLQAAKARARAIKAGK